MQGYLIETLFEFGISETIKSIDFCYIVVLCYSSYVEIDLGVVFIVVIDDGAD
jgi:hypothetical protein